MLVTIDIFLITLSLTLNEYCLIFLNFFTFEFFYLR